MIHSAPRLRMIPVGDDEMNNAKSWVHIADLGKHVGCLVSVRGWLQAHRSSGKVAFLQLRDGSGFCQCVVAADVPDAFAKTASLTLESSLTVVGEVRADQRAPGGFELLVRELDVIHIAAEYPISRKAHGTDFLMNHRHLWLRSPRQTAILRIRHRLIQAMRAFFDERGFTLIDTPLLTPGAAEGAGTLFPVDYFGDPVYLAQTGQLYLESAAMALGKVYCFGPTFRAEKSKTRRHLTEFWMLEPEVAFAELPEIAELAEALVMELVTTALRDCQAELAHLGREVAPLQKIALPFPRCTYSEVVDLLHSGQVRSQLEADMVAAENRLGELRAQLAEAEEARGGARKQWQQERLDQTLQQVREEIREVETRIRNLPAHMESAATFAWGQDLGGDEETIVSRQFDAPVIITHYPKTVKAFYMKPDPQDPRVVLNLDMIAPEGYGEIIGGSQREEDEHALLARMDEEGMDRAAYEWYVDLRRYGSVPHGGFGLGVERVVAWICGLRHIRETIPFPRLMGRLTP